MTGTSRSSDGLDERRRRLLFRSWHRGIREMDLIMGRFADVHLAGLSDDELGDYEKLIEVADPELFSWVTGAAAARPGYDSGLLRRLRDFHLGTSDKT